MKPWMMVVPVLFCLCTGCTMMSLERHTVALTDSAMDLRYREIMDNLARIASDPSALPHYSSIYSGTIIVQDQGSIVSTTTLPTDVGVQSANPSVNRQISPNWALDPITAPEKLEAIRAACQWAIGGQDHVFKESMSLLIDAQDAPPGVGRHFGVARDLAAMPPGWLGVGRREDVPRCACYKAHCNKVWVWVTPDGMKGLSDFALIIQNIARVGINSPSLFHLPPTFTPITFLTPDAAADSRLKVAVTAVVDQNGQLRPFAQYVPLRYETTGADAVLRSQISAAGIASAPH